MITRATLSTIEQGLPKYRSMLAGNSAYMPSAYESIATANPTGASVTFSSIPSTYAHLQFRGIYKDTSTSSTQEAPLYIQINGASSDYMQHYLRGNGASATAVGNVTQSWMRVDGAGMVSTTGYYGCFLIDFFNYSSASTRKVMKAIAGSTSNVAQTNYMVSLSSGLWMTTSAISSITIYAGNGGFASGSSIALYGIKGS